MNRKKITITVVSAAIFFFIAGAIIFRNLGVWLCVKDPLPENINVIMTFAGNIDRYDFSKEFVQNHRAAKWVLSVERLPVFDTVSMRFITERNLEIEGFDTSRVFIIDTCTSTFSELTALKWYLKEYEVSKEKTINVALISSPYHMYRIKKSAKKYIRQNNIKFFAVPVPDKHGQRVVYYPKEWWRHEDDAAFVVSEIIKIIYYKFRY